MRVSIKGMLKRLGAEDIDTASQGEDGIAKLSKRHYDVVICDYNLGEGKDGQQVLEEAKHRKVIAHSSVFVMVTAENYMPMVLGALEHQPDDYLVKPISREVFHRRIRELVVRKSRLAPIDEAIADEQLPKAIDLCRAAHGDDLRLKLMLIQLEAELCVRAGDWPRAERNYREAIAMRRFPWAVFGMGRVRFESGDYPNALGIFEGLLEESPLSLALYDWLARTLLKLGRPEQAQDVLQTANRLCPKSVRRQRELGHLALRNGAADVATRAFEEAIHHGQTSCFADADEYVSLANIMVEKGDTLKAVRLLGAGNKRFRHQPRESVAVLCAQARVKAHGGKQEEGRELLERAVKLLRERPESIDLETKFRMVGTAIELQQIESALDLMRILLGNHLEEPGVVERAGALFAESGLQEQGERLIDEVSRQMSSLNNEGVSLFKARRYADSLAMLIEATEAFPFNRTINLNAVKIMLAYMQQEGPDAALLFRARTCLEQVKRCGAVNEANRLMPALKSMEEGNRGEHRVRTE